MLPTGIKIARNQDSLGKTTTNHCTWKETTKKGLKETNIIPTTVLIQGTEHNHAAVAPTLLLSYIWCAKYDKNSKKNIYISLIKLYS